MSKGYSPEFRNRAVRMVGDCLSDDRSSTLQITTTTDTKTATPQQKPHPD